MIDVIIPAFNANEYIENALYSLVMQTYFDKINVFIIDDCSKENYHEIVKRFRKYLNIKEYKTKKNMGPGYARQYGIDKSNSEYIIFLDADDILYNCFAIEKLYNFISKNNYNVVSSIFTEQTHDNKEIIHYEDTNWLHGKIYRRRFLEENQIRFFDSRNYEDVAFNKLIYMLDDIIYFKYYTYVWKYNKESITRKDNCAFNYTSTSEFINNIYKCIKEAEKKKANKQKIAEIIFASLYELYYKYIEYNNKEIIENSKEIKELYLKYENELTEDIKEKITIDTFNQKIKKMGINKILYNENTFINFLSVI